MTSRREFLQIGFAATALPMAGSLLANPVSPAPTVGPALPLALPLYRVLFDERYALGTAFGAEAARAGASVAGFARGDITDFWFRDLDVRWRQSPVAIAGFTRHGPLFVLERCAWDRGLKVVFRGEHRPLPDGSTEHHLSGSDFSLYQAAALAGAGQEWSRLMAGIVTQCGAGCTTGQRELITRSGHRLPDDEPFYSWVIAPRA
jgi:hypothetical protein